MRRYLAVVLTVVLGVAACLATAGCSQQPDADSVIGSWTLTKITAEGTEVTGEQVAEVFGGVVSYDFQNGGKLVMSVSDSEVEGTWTQNGDKVTVDIGGDSGEGTVSGDTLTIEAGGGVSEYTRSA